MNDDLVVLTPEKTVVSYRLARIGPRMLAHFLDIFLIMTVLGLVGSLFGEAKIPFLFVLMVMFPFAYMILFEAFWQGQTLGKRAAGIRVRMADGTPVTPLAAAGRNLLRFADFVPFSYAVGIGAILVTPRSQRLGDMIANTIVINDKPPTLRQIVKPYELGTHEMEQYIGTLRAMTVQDYVTLRKLADRFPFLPTDVQENLVQTVWEPIRSRIGVPENPNVHPVYYIEATVMKYGREKGLL